MNLYERNQKQRSFFNWKINEYDASHQEFMNTKKELANNLDKDSKRIVTVIDITENMLEELKKRPFAEHVTTICGDFFEVEFGDNYDAVISTSALHHFTREEKEKLYKKIYNCLKTNGQFINCDRIALTEDFEEHQLYELEHNIENYKHIDTPLTVEHELEILREVGFKEITSSTVDKDDYSLIKARRK